MPVAGFFAERFKALAETFGLTVRTVDYEWGERIRPDEVAAALAEHPVKAVLLTQSETSTGVIQPIEQLAKVANDAGALVIVDVGVLARAPCRSSSTAGASTSRWAGRRRP